jgi:Ca2+/H+ antiporter, TMEM165/GDT1 family
MVRPGQRDGASVQGKTADDVPFRNTGRERRIVVARHSCPAGAKLMDAFLSSTLIVALAEIGDKTMLLAILLACRFGKPLQIVAGILLATIANHLLAAAAGVWLAGMIEARWFQFAVAIGFIVMAAWTLVPDSIDEDGAGAAHAAGSAFMVTLIAFFIAEMGDKTQVATVALGAQHQSLLWVTLGTTLGMMIANVPAVLLGDRITRILPMRIIRLAAAAVLALTGLWALYLATMTG